MSIVDPDFETYSEENPQDITKGESFAAEVVNRVMNGPGWPHTLLIPRSPAGTRPPNHRWTRSTWTPSPPSPNPRSCPSPRCAGAPGAASPSGKGSGT